jgi:hypothetical protein
MKKSSHSSTPKKKASPSREVITPLADAPVPDEPIDEPDLAGDQFSVAGREEEAASSGHRVEPIQPDEEGNAETLIEEGLHGFMRASPNHPHKAK